MCRPVIWAMTVLLYIQPLPISATLSAGTASTPMCREYIINGGFEEGSAGWVENSAGGYSLISNFHPRTGNLGAYLGGVNQADDRLAQRIALPAGVISATLTFWWAIATEEPGLGFDQMTASLLRSDGTLLADLVTLDSGAAENVWDQAEFALADYGGQTVMLRLHAVTDATNLTDFYLDDVSLIVCTSPTAVYLPMMLR